jgi:hypothetical protein
LIRPGQDVLIALMTLILSIKLVTTKLQAFRRIILLIAAIESMIVALASFFVILTIAFFTIGSAKFFVSPHSTGYIDAIIGEFWAAVSEAVSGGGQSETSKDQSKYTIALLTVLDFTQAVIVIMVLMNSITTMLSDSYSRVKNKAEVNIACLEFLSLEKYLTRVIFSFLVCPSRINIRRHGARSKFV